MLKGEVNRAGKIRADADPVLYQHLIAHHARLDGIGPGGHVDHMVKTFNVGDPAHGRAIDQDVDREKGFPGFSVHHDTRYLPRGACQGSPHRRDQKQYSNAV